MNVITTLLLMAYSVVAEPCIKIDSIGIGPGRGDMVAGVLRISGHNSCNVGVTGKEDLAVQISVGFYNSSGIRIDTRTLWVRNLEPGEGFLIRDDVYDKEVVTAKVRWVKEGD